MVLLQRIKWLILILSGCTFIYLLVLNFHTVNDHRDFAVYLQKLRMISDKLVRIGWDDTTVDQWRRSLEVHEDTAAQAHCMLNNIIIALPGETLQDHLWEYISLLVLRERWKNSGISLGVFLAPKSKKALVDVLQKVHMDSVEEYSSSCLDFKQAKILGHETNVELEHHPIDIPRLFLLERGAKRYMEVIHGDLQWLRGTVVLKKTLQDEAKKKVAAFKQTFGRNSTKEVFLVGLHFGPNHFPFNVPTETYRAAVRSVQLWHENAGVLVLCPKSRMQFCQDNFDDDPRARVLQADDQKNTLALLMHCQGNIIRSDITFIAALLNDGEAVVLQSGVSEFDPAATVAHLLPKWIMLEN